MRLQANIARAVAAGHATEHRRPALTEGGILRRPSVQPGQIVPIYSLTGLEPKAVVEIGRVTRARLHVVDARAARREGHVSLAAWMDAWLATHDRSWPPSQPCTRCDGDCTIDCATCWEDTPTGPVRVHPLDAHACDACDGTGQQPLPIDDDLVAERFADVWETREAWVIQWRAIAAPLTLTPAARPAGTDLGLTISLDDPLDAGEWVDPAELHPRWRENSRRRHTAARGHRALTGRTKRRA